MPKKSFDILCIPMRHLHLPRVMVHSEDEMEYYKSRGYERDWTDEAGKWELEVRARILQEQSVRHRFNKIWDWFFSRTRFSRLGSALSMSMPFRMKRGRW